MIKIWTTLLFENTVFFHCLSYILRANHKVILSHHSCSKNHCDLENLKKYKLLVPATGDGDSIRLQLSTGLVVSVVVVVRTQVILL